MRIAFLGLPIAALLLARDGHEVVLAAISREDAPGARRLRRRLGIDNVLMRPRLDDASFREKLRAGRPDILISWFWTNRIPSEVVAMAPLGGFGVHPSLLPRWRGPDPCFWAIDAGDEITGVTAHRLDAEYDTGRILGQRTLKIDPRWDAWTLARALDPPSLSLLRGLVEAFARGERPFERTQDEGHATAAPTPDDNLLQLDWHRDAASVVRRVRAAAPYPGAWTFIGDEALIVTRAELTARPRVLEPGEAAVVDGRGVVAAGSDGGVALLAGRIVGDDDVEVLVNAAQIAALVKSAGPHPKVVSG